MDGTSGKAAGSSVIKHIYIYSQPKTMENTLIYDIMGFNTPCYNHCSWPECLFVAKMEYGCGFKTIATARAVSNNFWLP